MIYRNSRYFDGPVTQVVNTSTGDYNILVFRAFPSSRYVTYVYYTWVDGDQIDHLAQVYLGDPALWYVIMDVNPEIWDPTSIKPGTKIRIPSASA